MSVRRCLVDPTVSLYARLRVCLCKVFDRLFHRDIRGLYRTTPVWRVISYWGLCGSTLIVDVIIVSLGILDLEFLEFCWWVNVVLSGDKSNFRIHLSSLPFSF